MKFKEKVARSIAIHQTKRLLLATLLLTVFLSIAYGIYINRTKQHSVELISGKVVDRVTTHTVVGNKHWLLVFIPREVETIKVRLPQGYPIRVGSKVMLQKNVYDDSGTQKYRFLRYED